MWTLSMYSMNSVYLCLRVLCVREVPVEVYSLCRLRLTLDTPLHGPIRYLNKSGLYAALWSTVTDSAVTGSAVTGFPVGSSPGAVSPVVGSAVAGSAVAGFAVAGYAHSTTLRSFVFVICLSGFIISLVWSETLHIVARNDWAQPS